MRRLIFMTVFGLWGLTVIVSAQAPTASPIWTISPVDRSKVDYSQMPLWAYGVAERPHATDPQAVQGAPWLPPPEPIPPAEANRKRRVEGSPLTFTRQEIRGNVVDWYPDDHPNPMPRIIKQGPAALVLGTTGRACGGCHLSDGSGRPENASPAGLPAKYILRQLNDFRNGLRHSTEPGKGNSNTMVMLAKAMTEEEMRQAAEYFSAVKWRPHVRVIETNLVPATRIQGELFIPTVNNVTEHKLTEPIGNRIIEVPTDVEVNQILRSSRGTWVAYVPVGAIARGRNLVTTGGSSIVNNQIVLGRATACTTCHGQDLRGMGQDIPPLAGRSPSYLAREIFDIQQGTRVGSYPLMPLMKKAVERLTAEDIIDITAYLASLPVDGPAPTTLTLTQR
jgi:cytochrome c553